MKRHYIQKNDNIGKRNDMQNRNDFEKRKHAKNRKRFATAATLLSTLAGFLFFTGGLMAIEEPEYTVIKENDGYEIREYKPVVAIETEVEADFEEAGNRAFRRLFNYIDGDNQSQTKVSMTAPVTQSAQNSESEKIAMTAPVTQSQRDGKFVIRFILPSKFTIDTAPKPNNPDVQLAEVPTRRYAVYTYSGFWSKSGYDEGLAKLKAALNKGGVEYKDEPVWSRYNSPFSLWFLRRNEIWLPIEE
ncbi:MAG: heme-binding protein [bacterium]|nr:heme-binding protein [bacterium]